MTRHARVLECDDAAPESGDRAAHALTHRYFAFMSYSHHDRKVARWLQNELERFRVPTELVGRRTDNGIIPPRLTPIFRDRRELGAAADLGVEIREALTSSRFLLVVCSPHAAASHWTNMEIAAFKRVRPDGCVLAVVVAGEPFASERPGEESEECLPPALRTRYDRIGRPTGKRAEPLAADLRDDQDGKRLGFLKVVAGLLGVGLDELVQRANLRRQKRMALVTGGSLLGMLLTSALAIAAVTARDAARDERREAEAMVGYMLGDLRTRLEPLGRLDVLDSVAARALEYYGRQDKESLSDRGLALRSNALTMMGEMANARGDLDRALRLYREAFAGTAEALRRRPDDPQRMWDHAQAVFWIGSIAWQRGRLDDAAVAFGEYKRLADRMVQADARDPKWRLERVYADTNLGLLLLDRRRFPEAAALFRESLEESERLTAAEPSNIAHQKQLLESLGYLSDAEEKSGRLEHAIAFRKRQLAIVQRLLAADPTDANLRRKALTAHRALGVYNAPTAHTMAALEHARRAVRIADDLIRIEPTNAEWMEHAAGAKLDLAAVLLRIGKADDADSAVRSGCMAVDRLTQRDPNVVQWRTQSRRCLTLRSQAALAHGRSGEALVLAGQALAATQSSGSGDAIEDAFALAIAHKLVGDIHHATGNRASAAREWQQGLSVWPADMIETPQQMEQRFELLKRLGKVGQARVLQKRLTEIGYRIA
jgi:eukaryotic-like serine/threonine-protein kinase